MNTIAAMALLLAVTGGGSPPTEVAVPFPAQGAAWTRIRLEARKGLLKGVIDIQARRQPADAARAALKEWPGGGARNPDGEVVEFETRTRATFKGEAERRTWLDRRGLLQDDGREGRRHSLRRFGDGAVHQWKERGKGSAEERRIELVGSGRPPRPVVDFASLLWLANGLRLDSEGASLAVSVVARGRLVDLDLRARELGEVEGGRGQSAIAARRVLITPADPELEAPLFGLRGDIDLWLDASDGRPLELRGTVAKLGAVRIRVVELEPEPPPAEAAAGR